MSQFRSGKARKWFRWSNPRQSLAKFVRSRICLIPVYGISPSFFFPPLAFFPSSERLGSSVPPPASLKRSIGGSARPGDSLAICHLELGQSRIVQAKPVTPRHPSPPKPSTILPLLCSSTDQPIVRAGITPTTRFVCSGNGLQPSTVAKVRSIRRHTCCYHMRRTWRVCDERLGRGH